MEELSPLATTIGAATHTGNLPKRCADGTEPRSLKNLLGM